METERFVTEIAGEHLTLQLLFPVVINLSGTAHINGEVLKEGRTFHVQSTTAGTPTDLILTSGHPHFLQPQLQNGKQTTRLPGIKTVGDGCPPDPGRKKSLKGDHPGT